MDLEKIKEQIDKKLKQKFDIITTVNEGNGDWIKNRAGSWPPGISFYEDSQCLNLFLRVQGKTKKLELTEWHLIMNTNGLRLRENLRLRRWRGPLQRGGPARLRENPIGVYGPRMMDKLLKQIFKTLSAGVYTCDDVVRG